MDTNEFPTEKISALVPDLCDVYQKHSSNRLYMVEEMAKLVSPCKEELEAAGFTVENTIEQLIEGIEQSLKKIKSDKEKTPKRVDVHSGDGSVHLGEGTYVGDVSVYVIQMPDGNLQSLSNAEQEPDPSDIPPGGYVRVSHNNPKIVLDSGQIVYGCQVWWEEVNS